MIHVMITGAGNGIGAELTRVFDQRGEFHFSLVDIDQPRLEHTASGLKNNSRLYQADLADIESLAPLVQKVEKTGPIDLLINNAGIMLVQKTATMPWQKAEAELKLDLLAPLRLMSLVLPGMVKRKSGGIINIASMAAVTPIPGCSYYCAAKAGLGIASEVTRAEVKDDHVHILTVYPGPISTDLERGARSSLEQSTVARMMPVGTPEGIAAEIFRAYQAGEARLVYPYAYEIGRQLPSLNHFFVESLAPQPLY